MRTPPSAGNVCARLDREHHAGLDRIVRQPRHAPSHARVLVNLQAQPVAGSMAECLPKPMPFKHFACGGVDRAGAGARSNGPDGRRLRQLDGVVKPPQILPGRPKLDRSSQIHAVSVVDAPEVQHGRLPYFERPVRRPRVRQRTVGPRGHDRVECRTAEPGVLHRHLDVERHVALTAAGGNERWQPPRDRRQPPRRLRGIVSISAWSLTMRTRSTSRSVATRTDDPLSPAASGPATRSGSQSFSASASAGPFS